MAFTEYQNQKVKIIKNMVVIVTTFFFGYAVINFMEGSTIIYIAEFILFGLGCIILFKINSWSKHWVEKFSLIFCIVLCAWLLLVLYLEELESTSHIWLITIPITAYLITGRKIGLHLTSISLITAIVIITVKEYFIESQISIESVLDVLLPYIWVWTLSHIYETSNDNNQTTLLDLATKDSLTNLYNRRAFYDIFADNTQYPVGLMEIDLDFFKKINDTYGHDAGDYVLKYVADKLLALNLKNVDVFRMGGEEFAILLPNFDLQQILALANQILIELRNTPINYKEHTIPITASIGIAIRYKAKDTGRDKIVYQ